MSKYIPTIGLEIHAELLTKTKMFCNSKNDTEEKRPNMNICPVCMGHPGTLPVINKEAVRQVLRVGVALGGDLASYTEFDRKNYFYPDIPKGYQISQYKYPLIKGGELSGVALTRIHLEEDTAKSTHDKGDESLVDFNRAGVPLMELVTEPVIRSAVEAANFARELQLLLWYLEASSANMEKGEMRVEANISVSKDGEKLGTKVEVKNLNSFKAVEKAIDFEVARQIEILERGESVVQETRGWDENKEVTFSQRKKEESHDYRYFPDPDLPKLKIDEVQGFDKESLSKTLPELPWERRERYTSALGFSEEVSSLYTRDLEKGQYIDKVIALMSNKEDLKVASNYLNSVIGVTNVPVDKFVVVVEMIRGGELSSRGAKDLLKQLETSNKDPRALAEEFGLIQKSNVEDLKIIIEKIISDNSEVVADYKKGKTESFQFLVGQVMKETKGSANPKVAGDILKELLS